MNEVKITHRAVFSDIPYISKLNRLGEATSLEEELPNMDSQEELRAHLMASDEEYRRLAAEHTDYARKLDELEALPHLSVEEEMEEHRLKKLKLRLKDQMEAIASRSRHRQVA
jgi:Archaeal fructose 1,6-bisphosphatase